MRLKKEVVLMKRIRIYQEILRDRALLLSVFLLLSSGTVVAREAMSKEEQVDTVKMIGRWLEVYTARCGTITSIPFPPCNDGAKAVEADEGVLTIKEFGDWLESCRTINIGIDSEDKIKKCKEAMARAWGR